MLDDSMTADAPVPRVPNEPQHGPSRWEPEFVEGAIIEWRCGECHKNVYYSLWNATYCPHCGAQIFNFPRRKLDAPQHRGTSYSDQEMMQYAGPGHISRRAQAEHPSLDGNRPGKTTNGKHASHSIPKLAKNRPR
jgi:DNA-directed RNA polymerase subunit RPC12/RpoP